MATKTLSDLPVASTPANADITHIRQSSVDKSLTLNLLSEFVQRDSDFADVIETKTADYDYPAAELEQDHRIFANVTAGDVALGLFNGSTRDGAVITVICNGTTNNVYLELVSTGVTDITLNSGDSMSFIWDNINSKWEKIIVTKKIIQSQLDFNSVIERVAANQYKIKDEYVSLYFCNLSGGYLFHGVTSILSGGDTWGYLQTNNCINFYFESGAYIQAGDTQFYLECNTDDCRIVNVDIKGIGSVATAIQRSYYNNANRTIFENCKTSSRLTNTNYTGFASITTNYTSSFNNCTVFNITSTSGTLDIFKFCNNILNCKIYNIIGTSLVYGFSQCRYINNCFVKEIESNGANVVGFYICEYVSNCKADTIDYTTAGVSNAYGFSSCRYINNCSATDIDIAGGTGTADGFYNCERITSSYALQCNYGFNDCTEITSSFTAVNSSGGFYNCNQITACQAYNNSGSFGFSGCYRVGCCLSENNGTYGFIGCRQLHSNRSTGNATANYNTSYADYAGTQAAADTAAGGYNA